MKLASLRDLFVSELRDVYSAENQILKALPKMAKAARAPELREAFENHLEQTKGHVERLDRIFEAIGISPKGKKCKAMEGLLEEGKEMLDADADPSVRDAGMIAGAQRVEHYEIAAYGCARTYARLLGDDESARLLGETLREEEETDETLTHIAESTVNIGAM